MEDFNFLSFHTKKRIWRKISFIKRKIYELVLPNDIKNPKPNQPTYQKDLDQIGNFYVASIEA